MKKLLLIASLAAMISASLIAEERFTKVGIIYIEQVFVMLAKDKEVRDALNIVVSEAKKKIETLAAEVNQLKQKLEKDTTLSDNRKKEIKNDIDWKTDELARLVKEQETGVVQKGEEYSKDTLRKISEAVKAVARKDGYTIILMKEESGVIFAEPEYDITVRVIDYLKKLAREAEKK
ncbi:MAG: OmpH family outer membrane protein [Spirochaetes bacterium]|nr:OmpH family outer membrane protein [Spirochaetota bacterium]